MSAVGAYELIGPVGTGSTSTVWKAHDVQLDRFVALKRLDNGTAELREQWRSEARVLATLDEPHIVEVYGFTEDEAASYIVEQWVDGATLAAVLAAAGRLSTAQALGVIRGALLGLAHAHTRGVVHRDVSTSNILVDEAGTSRLIDFGLAAGTGSMGSFGTSAYRSPEASSDQPATAASDVYSAAAVLTHLLAGAALTPPDVDRLDPALRDVVRRALAPAPGDRYRDAGEFLAALEDAALRRYGAAWWTEAGMAALASSAGVAIVASAASGKRSAPQPTLAAATVVLAPDPAARPLAGMTKRKKLIAAGAAGVVAVAGIGAAVAQGGDKKKPDVVAVALVAAPTPTPAPAASSSASSPAPTATPSSASSSASSSPTATTVSRTPSPAAPKVSAAQAISGVFTTSGVYRTINAKLIDDATRAPLRPGAVIGASTWTVTATCATPDKCTARVVSSSGLRYALALTNGRWKGKSAPIATACYDSDGALRTIKASLVVTLDLPDLSAKLTTAALPARVAGTQLRTYSNECGAGGTATATMVLTRKA